MDVREAGAAEFALQRAIEVQPAEPTLELPAIGSLGEVLQRVA
jgi:hypothetical protein